MNNARGVLHRRLEQWKSAANQLISGPEEEIEESEAIELDPALLEQCRTMAEAQGVTVNEAVRQIVEQYWARKSGELIVPISREQLERNPLLYLDALSERNIKLFGEAKYEYEPS
ncbi:hypothetical protein N0M98_17665 [Paenibacillus doosanensis]|uniref:Ribbon-helix-helix protein CopG domain-containing protein n=1 Tax=Paenibacillus konkukensis TaxID=2020716 RepID=A0ABY4RIS2_9BACL|nr:MULTISPECIES: hypothetical protein [Paenibacillus]MCS7461968.1 hypothetical protein [Paenibacillus doosanensis]UQZ81479.1 hypothetical protein SK3146_00635 [Paenibacillus konkukensis]